MTKRVLSLVLAVLMLFSIMPVYASESSAASGGAASGGGGAAATGPFLRGTVNVPSGYVFSGEEMLQIYIMESYESLGYECYTEAIINSDGTYEAYIPSDLTGSYAVSAYATGFSAPAVGGNYDCDNKAMITFTGGDVSGVDFTIEKGKTVSGQVTLGTDAVLENGVLFGWICAYEYDGDFIDMKEMGEGQFNTFFEGETGDFEFELTIPESVENIVLSVRARSGQMSEGSFKSNILDDYVYYAGDSSSLDYTEAHVISVNGNISDIDIQLHTGVGFSYYGKLPVNMYSQYANVYIEDADGTVIYTDSVYIDTVGTCRNIVLPKEYLNKEVYVYYDFKYNNDTLYTEPLYINPDGSLVKTKAEATTLTLTGANSVSFTAGLKSEFTTGIKGTISFEEGCVLNDYFNCTITAKNTVTGNWEYAYISGTGIGEYNYVLPVSENGTYIVWADISYYEEDSNVSECKYFYTSEGMVYNYDDAEIIDTTVKNTGIDFEFKKTKSFKGKFIADSELIYADKFKPEINIQSENGGYWQYITLNDDLTFDVQLPVSVQGNCTAYVYVGSGSNVVPGYYYYENDETCGTFDADAGETVEFNLITGNLIKGKIKLPEGVDTTYSMAFEICLATVNSSGYINVNQRYYAYVESGKNEAEFMFAVSKDTQTEYIIYGQLQGMYSNLYSENFYYTGNDKSSINQENAVKVTGPTEDIVFYAMTGKNTAITVVNPADGEYLNGRYAIDFGNFEKSGYFYLDAGETEKYSIVLTEEHIGLEAYVYYSINSHYNTYIYVNPDGSLTNNKNEAKPHIITENTSFNITLSSDESLYEIPTIKGTLSISESGYANYSDGEDATLEGNIYLLKDGYQAGYRYVEIKKGENIEFDFQPYEIGDYIISLYLNNWYCDTNVVCNKTVYYTGDGWSDKKEDAKIITNSVEQNLKLYAPELDVIKGNVRFSEDAFLNEEIYYQITYTASDGSGSKSKTGYISNAEDFEYKTTAIDGVDEYYVSIKFGSYYSNYDTNISCGKTYYYTENGLTTDETAVRKVVKATDNVVLNVPVLPTIKGTVNFPENAEISGEGYVYIRLDDPNGSRVRSKSYYIDKAEDFEFAIAGSEEIEKYSLSVSFNSQGYETDLEEGFLYYTKSGMTGNVNKREHYTIEELSGVNLILRNKRYITGKLVADNFVNYDEELTAGVMFQTDIMGRTGSVTFDDELNYKIEIPSEVDGAFYLGFSFSEEQKNNIVKNEFYYHADADGERKGITYPECENINIEAETGYIFSGVAKLPEAAVVYDDQEISGSVYFGSYYHSEFKIPYGETEGEFFMVVPKTGYTGLLYTSNIYKVDERAENLYAGMVYYKDKNTSVVNSEDGTKVKVNKDVTDAVIMLLTGEVYSIEFTKPANITTKEQINVYAEVVNQKITKAVTVNEDQTSATVSIVVPDEYSGKEMYIYYNLYYNYDNTLYRENVYINPDGSITGSKKLAEAFETGDGGAEISVTLADYTENELEFPEYIYRTSYPYKDNTDNVFSYEYTEEDCDYLKVTFAEETYLAYEYYSRRDCLYISYGEDNYFGPYYTNELAGKTVNIPGNSFTAYIVQKASTPAFGFAIESIEPKMYTLETDHPYISTVDKEYPYTHKTEAEGLRLHFSEDTSFNGRAKITYTDENGKTTTERYYSYNLAGRTIDVRGYEFTVTLPADSSGNYYGFSIIEIEEIEYCDVVFKNYDGTVLAEKEVEKGLSTYYSGSTPVRERDENYIYIFEGWDKELDSITEDTVLTAQYSENLYATVQFKSGTEDSEPLYTDYVILGESASFEGDVYPSKASTETKGYIFAGWDRSLRNIKEDTVITAEFKEYDIIIQNTSANEEQTYTYEGSADSIVLVFSSDSKIGEDDYLYFYDEKGNEVFCINGETLTEGEYVIVGKTVTLRLEGQNSYYALLQVAPMWHNFSDWYQYSDPDCTTEGMEYRYCYNCYTEEERKVSALGHSFGGWEEDPDGTISRECVKCAEREVFEGEMSDCGIVNINVVDAVTMKPLEFVTITSYDEMGNEAVWYTNADGVASQLLPKGINNLVVFLDGYIMRNIALDIVGGVTDVPVIGLTQKPAVECKLEAKIMDMEEIKAAGIDTSDPLNSHVYKYSINLGFGGKQDVYFNKEGTYIDRGGIVVRDDKTDTTARIHPVNDKYYLVIYGQSKWLKEMFDVELVAVNTSNTDTVENLVAELKIPDGMSLAAMDRVQQTDVQRMGSLASGESKSVHWYLRGDDEGEYNLSAKLTGTLMPFNEQFGYEYTTDEPVKVYAGSALQMNLVVPAVVTYGEDCTVKIEIKNVSDRSVYNLSNSIDKVLQSKLLTVDKDGYEKYYEENALGYVAVDELKPGEKIVAEIKSNILFESEVIKNKIDSLANRLQSATDVLAIFNSYKSTLDLFNDNYDIIYNALGNVTRSKEHLTAEQKALVDALETVLAKCENLVKDGVSSRAMYFINRLKQENTLEELAKLSKDSNYYTVWQNEKINRLTQELNELYNEATDPENCGDYDIYEDVKRVVEAVPVSFWLKDVFVTKLEGSTTEIPYTVTVIPAKESYTGVTNISNYYYNILTNAIDRLSQPWYTELMGEIRDPEGVAEANKIIKTDIGKTLIFAVTDVTGDTRFNAWVEGESGKPFEISSTAENVEVTESGITFTGPAYLSVSALAEGEGTLYVEKVSEIATFTTEGNVYSFELEAGAAHNCASEKWVEIVTAYDDNDGYYAKYCDICGELIDMKTDKATNDCSSGSYEVTNEQLTDKGYSCTLTFDGETPARSAVAVVIMKDENGKTVCTGTDAIKIKPNSTVDVEIPLNNAESLTPKVLLWDSLSRLRPVGR